MSGSSKYNIDPFDTHSVWKLRGAIEELDLAKHFHTDSENDLLEYAIEGRGKNLSAGQRQLLCICRAILDKNVKIILLDEATANIDAETDAAIQRAMVAGFVGKTMLTIAHRIETIMNCDKVILLDEGTVSEVGNPKKLLSNRDTKFYNFVNAKSIEETGEAPAVFEGSEI